MKKFNWIDALIIILFLLSIYFILTRIFGHSASDFTIMVTLFTFLCGIMFKLTHILFNLNREVGEFKVKTINSFSNIKEDMSLLKKDILLIKDKLKIK